MKKVFTSILSSVNVGIVTCLVALMATSCSYKSANISSLKPQDIEWKSKEAISSTVVENSTAAPKTISAEEFKTTIKEEIVKSNPGVTLSPKQEKQLDKLSNVLAKKYNKLSPAKKAEINKKAETLKNSSEGLKKGLILAVIGLLIMSLAYYVPVVGWLVAIVGAVLLIYGVYLVLMEIL